MDAASQYALGMLVVVAAIFLFLWFLDRDDDYSS